MGSDQRAVISQARELRKRREFLSFSPPSIGPEEIEEVVATLKTDWIATGSKTRRFEGEFGAFVGTPAALAVSSATDALQVGLAALGIAEGDEVITTPMTFCSTVHVIEHMRSGPVVVDVAQPTHRLIRPASTRQ